MGLNELFELTSQVASTALPIIGCIVLVYLAIFFKHLITVVKEANKTVQSLKAKMCIRDSLCTDDIFPIIGLFALCNHRGYIGCLLYDPLF